MQAAVYAAYGGPEVLSIENVDMPEPTEGDVRIRVHAASINAGDWHLMRGKPFLMRLMFGVRCPNIHILGSDVAGVVDAVGTRVVRFQPGDAVCADLSPWGFGAFAEFACAPEDAFTRIPSGSSFAQAAASPVAAVTALQGLRDHGRIQAGDRVLVHGASGGVGTFAIQLAKHLGAHVAAVCRGDKADIARGAGASRVFDYTCEDYTRSGEHFDLILDAGAHRSIWDHHRALHPRGRYVFVGGSTRALIQAMLLGPWMSIASTKSFKSLLVKPNRADLECVMDLLGQGRIVPRIDSEWPLRELSGAMRHYEGRRAGGKIIIAVA